MKQFNLYMTLVFAAILTGGCGGDDSSATHVTTYTGSTAEASMDASKADTYTKATNDAILNVFEVDSIQSPVKSNNARMMATHKQTVNLLMQETVPGFCDTGSVDVSGTETSGTIRYTNCSYYGMTFNGTATYTTSNNFANFSLTYTNFTIITDGSGTETIENMTIFCTDGDINCTFSSDFTGSDGLVYQIENLYTSDTIPYEISGRLYHRNHGYVDISASFTLSTCDTVQRPTDGTLTLTGSNGIATITFIDCDSFNIDFDSAVTTGNW